MLRDGNKIVTTTMAHRTDEAIEEAAAQRWLPSLPIAKQRRIQPFCFETLQRMHKAGISWLWGLIWA